MKATKLQKVKPLAERGLLKWPVHDLIPHFVPSFVPLELLVNSMLSCTLNFSSETAISFPNWDLRLALSSLSFCCCVSGQGIKESKTHSLSLMAGCFKCFWLPWMVPLSSFWISHLSQRKVNWQAYGSRQTYLGLVSWEGSAAGRRKSLPGIYLRSGGWGTAQKFAGFLLDLWCLPSSVCLSGICPAPSPSFWSGTCLFLKIVFVFLSLGSQLFRTCRGGRPSVLTGALSRPLALSSEMPPPFEEPASYQPSSLSGVTCKLSSGPKVTEDFRS